MDYFRGHGADEDSRKPMERTGWRGGKGAGARFDGARANLRWGKSEVFTFATTVGVIPPALVSSNLVYAHADGAFAWQIQIGVDASSLALVSEAAPLTVTVTTTIGNGQDATALIKSYSLTAPYPMLLDNGMVPVDTIQSLTIQVAYAAAALATAQQSIRVLAYAAPVCAAPELGAP